MDEKLAKIKSDSQKMIEQIKKYSPQLAKLLNLTVTLKEYSSILKNFNPPKEHLERQKLIKKVLSAKIESLFGKKELKHSKGGLEGNLSFNIADHHQILNHPFLMSANMVSSVDKLLESKKQEHIIVTSSGDVPPNNFFSQYGFIFHDHRIPVFSNKERESTSYYLPKRDFNFIEKLKLADRWKDLNNEEREFLIKEYEKIKSYDFSKCNDYNDQISIIVKNMWPYLFEEKLRKNLPELIYITQEEITTQCLIELLQEDNIVSRCLFDQEFRREVYDNFRGIVVTWDEQKEKGTHFFWRKYPGRSQSLRLYEENGKLVPTDSRFKDLSVPLEKDVIIELLKKKEIYPSLFMIFAVLNFYSGVKPLVGIGSMIYLDLMKQAWLKTLKKFNLDDEIKLMQTIDTDSLVAGLVLFFKRQGDIVKSLYAYDIIYDGGATEEYLNKIFNMNVSDFFYVGSGWIYEYLLSKKKYIPEKEIIKTKITIDDLASIKFNWL